MNYYEELGVSRFATTPEIQQAYRALVRILHPDQQQDAKLRRLSELQLMRLNQMAKVLTDPDRRRQYDRTLDKPVSFVIRRPASFWEPVVRVRLKVRPHPGIFAWAGIGFVLAIILFLWAQQTSPALSGATMTPPAKVEEKPPAPLQVASLRPPEPVVTPEPQKVTPPKPKAAPPTPPAKPWGPGKWSYTGRQGEISQSIEMQISYKAGLMHGKYVAKRASPDEPASPEVRFQFQGRLNNPVSVMPWSSPSGSRGEVWLKKLSDKAVEVTWMTTVFGKAGMPTSGKAVLSRNVSARATN